MFVPNFKATRQRTHPQWIKQILMTSRRCDVIKISTPLRHAPYPPLYPAQVGDGQTQIELVDLVQLFKFFGKKNNFS